ncbi:major facilitator superfamily domain-containing protein [Dactylonectria macrodidyma]|uniref:Major facilitator superfamily domain-containing protein n=1 Tax=Dactylonectria macrodidyma TaxID=307937 RepID=A0A9P9DV80_9HYPO|nr:major facilitator superfamily domain-containing protein [Dactylonectria macrodidyma]
MESDSKTPANSSAPPVEGAEEGGFLAWLQVAGCFFLYWNTLGLINTFGVFQTFYENDLLADMSSSAISWIGSIQMFLLMSVGIIIGPLYDAGHCRLIIITGTFLVVFGFMMTSVCKTYWQVLLAHAVCVGLGTSCLSIPSIAIVPQYFKIRRARAMSMATLGSCVGGTVYPLIFQELQPRIGFPWTVRLFGFISLAMCCFSLAVLRPRLHGGKRFKGVQSLIDPSAFASSSFTVYAVGIFFTNVAWFVPVFYLQTYALNHGLAGQGIALYLVAILNAASIPGRILLAMVSDKVGPLNTLAFITAATGIVTFSWAAVETGAGNIVFSVFYGFFSGSLVAVAPVVLASFTTDLSRLGTRLGMVALLKGFGSLIGSPVAGAILARSGGYLGVQLFTGLCFMVTFVFLVALRIILGGMTWNVKL